MSMEARQRVANSPKMYYTSSTQKADLLDPKKTNTYLIAMLEWQIDNSYLQILVLAINSDHSPSGQHVVGCAIDCYPQNWATGEQTTCTDMMKGFAKNPFCEAVGLGGITKRWKGNVQWPPPSDCFVVFDDNDTDHIHASCANAVDPPGARAKKMGYTKYTG